MPRIAFADRVWAHIDKGGPDECWPWNRSRAVRGYGHTTHQVNGVRRNMTAHRAVYELVHGEIPASMCVCHRCDNPPCCNPAHLFLGTFADNNRDRKNKGRNGTSAFTGFSTDPPRGERNRHAKLTAEQVTEFRAQYQDGTLNQRQTAFSLGVHPTTLNRIVRGMSWSHL